MGLFDKVVDGVVTAVSDRLMGSFEGDLIKAGKAPGGAKGGAVVPGDDAPTDPIQALMWDPFALLETMGYRERYSMVSYNSLLQLSIKVPIYPGILQLRRNQVTNFSEPQEDVNLAGWKIIMRDRKAKPSKDDQRNCSDIECFIEECGITSSFQRDSFCTFLKKWVRDSKIYDQGCFEIEHTRGLVKGRGPAVMERKRVPANFYAIDGGSIRIADTPWSGDQNNKDDEISYVQVHDENVVAEFTPRQLCFGVRNPRTDLRVNGYGMSELEMGAHILTSMIFSYQYNSRFFTQGSVAKGMLNLPEVTDTKLRIFARQWHMITSGVMNAWRTPITNFKDATWLDFHTNNRDMEFSEWMNFLLRLYTAIEGVDTTELGFIFGNIGQSSQMSGSPEETRVKESKDRGLRPLMSFLAEKINRWIVWPLDDRYKFVWTGLDPRAAEQQVGIYKQQVGFMKTVDEIRAEQDLMPLKDGLGDLILDPNYMQAWQAKQTENQQEEMGGEEGMEGQEGAPAGGEEEGAPPDEDDWTALTGMSEIGADDVGQPEAAAKKSLRRPRKGKALVKHLAAGEMDIYEIDLDDLED